MAAHLKKAGFMQNLPPIKDVIDLTGGSKVTTRYQGAMGDYSMVRTWN